MSAGKSAKTLTQVLEGARYKVEDLRKICDWAEIEKEGKKVVLVARIVEHAKNSDVDFAAADLDDLTYLQIFAECLARDLPSVGKRSVLQATLEAHLGRDKGGEEVEEHKNRAFLREKGLNVSGGEMEWQARIALYKDGKHSFEFQDMGLKRLNEFAELYAIKTSESRKMVLSALLTNFEGMQGRKRGRDEEDDELEKTRSGPESFKSPRTVRKTGAGGVKSGKAGRGGKAVEESPGLPRSKGKKPKAARKLREEESGDDEEEEDEYEQRIDLVEDDDGPTERREKGRVLKPPRAESTRGDEKMSLAMEAMIKSLQASTEATQVLLKRGADKTADGQAADIGQRR